MNINKRSVCNVLKKVVYVCVAFFTIVVALTVALAISKVVFYILLYALYVIGAFGIAILWLKMMSKILHYIERRKKNK